MKTVKKNANTVINLSLNESNGSEKLNSNCKELTRDNNTHDKHTHYKVLLKNTSIRTEKR